MIASRTFASLAVVSVLLGGCALLLPAPQPTGIRGWTTAPTPPDPEFAAVAERQCLSFPDAPGTLVIQDQRGPDGALFLFEDGDRRASCMVLRHPRGALLSDGGGYGTGPWQGGLHLYEVSTGHMANGLVITEHLGTVPAGTSTVEIETEDGGVVQATVAGDRFGAWWPSDEDSVSVRSLDVSGTVIEAIEGSAQGLMSSPGPSA